MNLRVLDTDVTSLLLQAHPAIVQRVRSLPPDQVAVTVITVEEQLTGWYTAIRRAKQPDKLPPLYDRLAAAVRAMSSIAIVSFSSSDLQRFQLLSGLRLNIGKMDLRIAAIVLEQGATLVTRNLRDFQRVPGLQIDHWAV